MKLANKANTEIGKTPNGFLVTYYGHTIFTWDMSNASITFDTCGYDTVSTLRHMNEALKFFGFEGRVYKSKGRVYYNKYSVLDRYDSLLFVGGRLEVTL
jgi:hypothetical protein